MARTRTARCAFCNETFTFERRSGPTPSYCSQAHRQRAYEQRRHATRSDDEQNLADEVRTLRARIARLERENRELRRERDDAFQENLRLRQQSDPLPAAVHRLATAPHAAAAAPPPPPSPPLQPARRRWKPSR